jgi:hypothetical protein
LDAVSRRDRQRKGEAMQIRRVLGTLAPARNI